MSEILNKILEHLRGHEPMSCILGNVTAADIITEFLGLQRQLAEATQRAEAAEQRAKAIELECEFVSKVYTERDSLRAANAKMREACGGLVASCEGRVPPDSSDSVLVEAIHVRRIAAALSPAPGEPVKCEEIHAGDRLPMCSIVFHGKEILVLIDYDPMRLTHSVLDQYAKEYAFERNRLSISPPVARIALAHPAQPERGKVDPAYNVAFDRVVAQPEGESKLTREGEK